MTLLHTPLYDTHVERGGRMVEFGGWEMPVQYDASGVLAEHAAVRKQAGIFDVSHMGRIDIRGPNAAAFLDRLITSNVGKLRIGRGRYGLICNRDGGVIDDVVVFRRAESVYLLVCNASRWDRVTEWMAENAMDGVEITHRRDDTAMLAVQGPEAVAAVARHFHPSPLQLKRFAGEGGRMAGVNAFISRTGYTGEDGCELIVSADDAPHVWNTLVDESGVVPCGLAARDVLRLEAGLMLYGQDMDESTTPLEAGLDRFVDLEKDFIGSEQLREQARTGVEQRITALTVQGRSSPRHGYTVRTAGGYESVITSGTYSPVLEYSIALAYLPAGVSEPGNAVDVDIRGRAVSATTTTLPFLQR